MFVSQVSHLKGVVVGAMFPLLPVYVKLQVKSLQRSLRVLRRRHRRPLHRLLVRAEASVRGGVKIYDVPALETLRVIDTGVRLDDPKPIVDGVLGALCMLGRILGCLWGVCGVFVGCLEAC